MRTMQASSQLVTVGVLEQILDQKFSAFGKTFGSELSDNIMLRVRDELDSKLAATENRIITTLRGELDERTHILLQAMSDMVEPMQVKDDEREN